MRTPWKNTGCKPRAGNLKAETFYRAKKNPKNKKTKKNPKKHVIKEHQVHVRRTHEPALRDFY